MSAAEHSIIALVRGHAETWHRRAYRLVLLLVLLRACLWVGLPIAIRSFGHSHGLLIEWNSLDLSFLTGRIELDDARITVEDPEGYSGSEIARIDDLLLDVGVLSCLAFSPRIERFDVQGITLFLRRDAAGTWELARHFPPSAEVVEVEADEPHSSATFDLRLPWILDEARIGALCVVIRDEHASPPVAATFTLDAAIDHVNGMTGSFEARAVLGSARAKITGTHRSRREQAFVACAAQLHGFDPRPFEGWLAPLGLRALPEGLDGQARIEGELFVRGEQRDTLSGMLTIADAALSSTANESVGLGRVTIDLARLTRSEVAVRSVEIDRPNADVALLPDGAIRACGIEIAPVAGTPGSPAPQTPLHEAPRSNEQLERKIIIDRFEVLDGVLRVRDLHFDPALALEARLDALKVFELDSSAVAAPARVFAQASLPGAIESLAVSGTLDPLGPSRSAHLTVTSAGITLESIRPYLARAGLRPAIQRGTLSCVLDAQTHESANAVWSGGARLSELSLKSGSDGDSAELRELFALEHAEVVQATFDPACLLACIERVAVHGLRSSLARAQDGGLEVFGLGTIAVHPISAPGASAPITAETNAHAVKPAVATKGAGAEPTFRIELAHLDLAGNNSSWSDTVLPSSILVEDFGLEAANLAFGGDPETAERTTATVRAWIASQALARRFEVSGSLASRPGPLDLAVELTAEAEGIRLTPLQPYLTPLGVESRLLDAKAGFRLSGSVQATSNGLAVGFELGALHLTEGASTLASIARAKLAGARLVGESARVGAFEIDGLTAAISREVDGSIRALGLCFAPHVQPIPSADQPSNSAQVVATTELSLPGLPDVSLDTFRLRNASIAWHDATKSPPFELTSTIHAGLDHLVTRSPARPADFSIVVEAPKIVDSITLKGALTLAEDSMRVHAQVHAEDVHGQELAAYLPGDMRCELEQGVLDLTLEADAARVREGGLGLKLALHDVAIEDRARAQSPLSLKSVTISVPRVDPHAGILDIESVSVEGASLRIEKDENGAQHALGFVVERAPLSPPESATAPSLAEPARKRKFSGIPRITLGALALDLERFEFVDRSTGSGAKPLVVSARLSTSAPFVLVEREPARAPGFQVTLTGSVSPLARTVNATLELDPWSEEPTFAVALAVDGLRGEGITELLPALSETVDGRGLTEGTLRAALRGRLKWTRRGPLDLDLMHGFAAEVVLGPLELRETPGGRVMAGIDSVTVEARRVDFSAGLVDVKSVEVLVPRASVQRAGNGLHVAGLVLKPQSSAAVPGALELTTSSSSEASRSPSATTGEIKIDELVVHGIDLQFTDLSTDPPSLLPLTELDVELKTLTTRALVEPRPIQFALYLGSGVVDLHKRVSASNVLMGVAGAVGSAIGGSTSEEKREARKVFEECALSGRIVLYPELSGHAQLNLTAFELASVRGMAQAAGVTIGDGVLDTNVRLRFKGSDGITVDSTHTFSDLALSEPKNGAIEKYLALPVPLDTLLFLLENAQGEHRVPVSLSLEHGSLGSGAGLNAATGAVGSVLAQAVAGAPVRALTTFTDLFGITGETEPKAQEPARVKFSAGSVALDTTHLADLAPLVERLRIDRDFVVVMQHRLARADVERAEQRANPSAATCLELVEHLRRERAQLVRARDEIAARARASFAVGRGGDATIAIENLRGLDRDMGNTERALDGVLEILRPGAERYRDKRTRNAALDIGRRRLAALEAYLRASGIHDIERRIETRPVIYDVSADDEPGLVFVKLQARKS